MGSDVGAEILNAHDESFHSGTGDLVGLRWDDVNFDTGLVWIGNSKTGDGFYNPVNSEARELLLTLRQRVREIQKETDPARIIPYVFVDGEGNDYTKRSPVVSRAFKRAQIRAGVFKGSPAHILRHTTGSHKNIKTTMRYAHLQPDHLKGVMEVLEQRMSSTSAEKGREK